jgi:hypothetical protein
MLGRVVRRRGAARGADHRTHDPGDAELAEIVAFAGTIGATAVWFQSRLAEDGTPDKTGCWLPDDESQRAREIVESAGMSYVEKPYIADAVRDLAART